MSKIERLEEIDLNITNRCNIGCSHCLFAAGPECGDDLPINAVRNVLREGKELGAEEVHISGGEPTIRKEFRNILEMSHDLGYFTRLQTNLWNFDEDMLPTILRTTDEVLTSVDGLRLSHDTIRREGSFDKTVAAIGKLLEADVRVVVITAVQRKNYDDIPNLVEQLGDIGVNAHFLFSVTPLGRAKKEDIVSPTEWESLIGELHDRDRAKETQTDIVCELHHLRGDEAITYKGADCRLYTRNHAIVLPDGNVFPCSMFITTDKSLGNVNEEAFGVIWRESQVWDFYCNKIDDPSCVSCNLWAICKGGCPGYSYLLSGDITSKDPRCEPGLYPVCPSWKLNVKESVLSCSTWRVMER